MKIKHWFNYLMIALLTVSFMSCKKENDPAPALSVNAQTAQLVGNDGNNYTQTGIQVTAGNGNTTFLTDQAGKTLYIFIKDFAGVSNYTGAAASWPKFTATISTVATGFDKSDFGTTSDGQVTYKGWPLYYFGGDAAAGETKGVSVPTPGVWPVVTSDLPAAAVEPDVKASTAQLVGADGNNYTQTGKTVTAGNGNTTFLTDKAGKTLYIFIKDFAGVSNYTGAAATWPVYKATIENVPDGFNKSDFGTTSDGQVTYKGWPLYYYGGDAAAGETKGISVPMPGVWPAVTSDLPAASAEPDVKARTAQLVGADGKNYTQTGKAVTEAAGMTTFLTDKDGKTLYIFKNDTNGTSNYSGAAATWPLYKATINNVPTGFSKSDFGTTSTGQVTYKGWPLYYYGGDTNVGDTKGVSVPTPGVWPSVTSDLPQAQ